MAQVSAESDLKKDFILVRMKTEDKDELLKICGQNDIPMSRFVRNAIRSAIERVKINERVNPT